MAAITPSEMRSCLRSGAYTLVFAAEITPVNAIYYLGSSHEFFLQGGTLRVATSTITASSKVCYGIMDMPNGIKASLPADLLGKPPVGAGSIKIRINYPGLPDFFADMSNIDWESAEIEYKVGWKGLPFEDMLTIHKGKVRNPKFEDNRGSLLCRFGGIDAALDKRVYDLGGGSNASCNTSGQMVFGRAARVPAQVTGRNGSSDWEFSILNNPGWIATIDKVYVDGWETAAYTSDSSCKITITDSDTWEVDSSGGAIGISETVAVDYTEGDWNAEDIIQNIIDQSDIAHLPFASFTVNVPATFNAPYQSGIVLPYSDDSGNLSTLTWNDVLKAVVGGTGGTWQFNRDGELVLVYAYLDYWFDDADIVGRIYKNDFVSIESEALPNYSEVIVTGAEWGAIPPAYSSTPEDDYKYSETSGTTTDETGKKPLTIESAITKTTDAKTLADLVFARRFKLKHKLAGCPTGMTYNCGDKLAIVEEINDQLPVGTLVMVVSVPKTKDSILEVVS